MKIILVLLFVLQAAFSLNREGLPGVYKTYSAQTMGHGKLGIGMLGTLSTYADVLQFEATDQEATGTLASLSGYPFLSVGLSNFFDLGVSLPIYRDDISEYKGMDKTQIGDLKAKLKLQLPYFAERHIVDAALVLGGVLPTAGLGSGALYREVDYIVNPTYTEDSPVFGHRAYGLDYLLALTLDFGQIHTSLPILWHFNTGFRQHFVDENHDVFLYGTAIEYRILSFLTTFAEFKHETLTDSLGSSHEFKTQPTTLAAGGILHTPLGINIQFGAVFGLNQYRIPTSFTRNDRSELISVRLNPPVMTFIGLNWQGWLVLQDTDKDGIPNKNDACIKSPEDMDGFQDLDGCPDLDNDQDGTPDHLDVCANQPEDVDAFQDSDGCPDIDNDGDGIPDPKDACPIMAEDLDGYEDADGCPEGDNDKDGVSDTLDLCPMVAEDLDGFQDIDGCAEVDNDSDAVLDASDKCPNQAENINGFEDTDGCPDQVPQVVKPAEIRNVTLKGVNFKTGSSDLTYESFLVLQGVVEQLLAYPEVNVEIHGHTNNVGKDEANQKLSEKRAQAVVDYLVKQGVLENRLKAKGFGKTNPIASNATAEGRAQNRRIEMYRVP